MDDFSSKVLERLILEGAAEVAGVDMETGEFLYSFTSKLSDVSPEIYKQVTNMFYDSVMVLWEKGFVEIDMDSDNPTVSLNAKAYNTDEVEEMSTLERRTLDCLLDQFKNK